MKVLHRTLVWMYFRWCFRTIYFDGRHKYIGPTYIVLEYTSNMIFHTKKKQQTKLPHHNALALKDLKLLPAAHWKPTPHTAVPVTSAARRCLQICEAHYRRRHRPCCQPTGTPTDTESTFERGLSSWIW